MPKSVYAVAVGWCRGQGEGDFFRTQPYSQANFGDDHSIFDSGFVLSLANALVEAMLSGADVELPAVPGAGHDAAFERSASERPTLVRADAIKRKIGPIHVKQRDDAAGGNELFGRTKGHVTHTRKLGPGGHCKLSWKMSVAVAVLGVKRPLAYPAAGGNGKVPAMLSRLECTTCQGQAAFDCEDSSS